MDSNTECIEWWANFTITKHQMCMGQAWIFFFLYDGRAHLVPVFAFGQNNVISRQLKLNGLLTAYHIGRSKWEKWIKVFLKSCSVLPYAQYCVMPYSTPITVVGKLFSILEPKVTLL